MGTIVAWPVATNPPDAANWLECNGQSTSGYPELAAVMGAAVPDLRGKFLRGLGGNSAGLGVAQGDAMRNFTGTLSAMLQRNELVDSSGVFSHTTSNYGEEGGRNSRAETPVYKLGSSD